MMNLSKQSQQMGMKVPAKQVAGRRMPVSRRGAVAVRAEKVCLSCVGCC